MCLPFWRFLSFLDYPTTLILLLQNSIMGCTTKGTMMKTQIIHWDGTFKAYFSVFKELIANLLLQFVVNTLEKFFLMCFVRFL